MCAFCSGAWDTTALSPRHSNTPSSCLSGNNRMPPSLTRISQILRLPAWSPCSTSGFPTRSEEHTSELQSRLHLVCRLLLEKKKQHIPHIGYITSAISREELRTFDCPQDHVFVDTVREG